MALETASNPTTGETVVLVNNEWIPAAETATNPDTGATAYLVNNKWLVKEPPPKAPASIRDTAVSLAQGVVGAGKSLSDVFGADTALSGALGNIQQSLGESYQNGKRSFNAGRLQQKPLPSPVTQWKRLAPSSVGLKKHRYSP